MWVYALTIVVVYVASIYSWPPIRIWLIGDHAELTDLRRKAGELELKIRKAL